MMNNVEVPRFDFDIPVASISKLKVYVWIANNIKGKIRINVNIMK